MIVLPVQAFLPLPPAEPLPRLALLRHKVTRAVTLHRGNLRLLQQTPPATSNLSLPPAPARTTPAPAIWNH